MKAKKLTALLITLILFIAVIAQDDSDEQAGELLDTYQASCILKITANPNILPMNSQIMYYLLTSSAVAGKASRQVLNVSFEEISNSISIEMLPSDQDNIPGIRGGMMRGMGGGMGGGGMGGGMGGMGGSMRGRMGGGMGEGGGGGFGGGMGGGMMGDMTSEEIVISSEPEEENSESKYITTVSKVYTSGRGSAGSSRTIRPPARTTTSDERTAVFHLQIDIPTDYEPQLKPAAFQFQKAIINNLRDSLKHSYVVQKRQLEDERRLADNQLLNAEQQLQQVMGIDAAANYDTQLQLDEKVDLSILTPETTFADALDILKSSVEPPLQIKVNWKELYDIGDIDQTTQINMDGLKDVRLSKALEFLLDSVSGGYVELGYQIDDGIITISTEIELSSSQPAPAQMFRQDISLDYLLEQKRRLFDNKQSYEMNIASYDARQIAMQDQISRLQAEMDYKLQKDPANLELQKLLDIQSEHLNNTNSLVEAGRATSDDLVNAERKLSEAKIALAQYRQMFNRQMRGSQIEEYNNELSRRAIDVAESTAQLGIITKQLEQLAQNRLMQIETKLANLQPPTVTVLGAD
ncbi:MAG: hypothetical protein ACYSUK_08850 [Planctomycetota bacterium]|jgi:hypothetical protein